jgi:dGTPase
MMNWEKLLSYQRMDEDSNISTVRTGFEKDFDRIVFSASFRQLQDKTQVVPLPEDAFVHTRLTHSLEVSCVGRSLGKNAGYYLIEKYPNLKNSINESDIAAIVAAACLAHDIGNPPFGHSGEKAISDYFINGNGKKWFDTVESKDQWEDLTSFEGNANGFRLLVNSVTHPKKGMNLSLPTLAAFTKYPKASLPNLKSTKKNIFKKYGFFQTEKGFFQKVADGVGLKKYDESTWYRHPLAFLVEAADDICYSIIDFEDALNLGLIGEEKLSLLKEICQPILDEEKLDNIADYNSKIAYLRALSINVLANEVGKVFEENEEKMLAGEFYDSLIDFIPQKDIVKTIKSITLQKLYKSKTVLEIEAAGFEVISGLLDLFIHAVHYKRYDLEKKNYYLDKILEIIPQQYQNTPNDGDGFYTNIIQICEYIAGMTDSFAIALYKKFKGIQLPKL